MTKPNVKILKEKAKRESSTTKVHNIAKRLKKTRRSEKVKHPKAMAM